ncbi:hypothetical protein LOAG_03145 [Loa loa]|uniref:Uncharacterized protein n=1 Tax=Loa loa TaxID=7209 RepID=A0A1S0U4Z7_LOALO|nr:hypothetical protein LOAG_03145 [Loa loa]EFO25334.1 hypothetical protein LOAG_03145 [Loa loa]
MDDEKMLSAFHRDFEILSSKARNVFSFIEQLCAPICVITFSVLKISGDESDSVQHSTYRAIPATLFRTMNPYMNSLRSPDVNILSSYADERSWKRALGPRPLRFG